jgi:hypothetical protein
MDTQTDGGAVVARVMALSARNFCDDTTIQPQNANTWTFRTDRLAGGYVVFTSWSPIRFAPAYGLKGESRHFESIVINKAMPDFIGDSRTYLTEADAREGHAVMVSKLRSLVEAA